MLHCGIGNTGSRGFRLYLPAEDGCGKNARSTTGAEKHGTLVFYLCTPNYEQETHHCFAPVVESTTCPLAWTPATPGRDEQRQPLAVYPAHLGAFPEAAIQTRYIRGPKLDRLM